MKLEWVIFALLSILVVLAGVILFIMLTDEGRNFNKPPFEKRNQVGYEQRQ